jgi:hypothetical protein
MKRGWAGFEEAFDRIVPPDGEDYAAIKRDLLREPVFNMQAHRHGRCSTRQENSR